VEGDLVRERSARRASREADVRKLSQEERRSARFQGATVSNSTRFAGDPGNRAISALSQPSSTSISGETRRGFPPKAERHP
jgi:hypothetical protein